MSDKSLLSSPLVNGYEYGWSNIQVLISGSPAFGITSISYSDNVEFENLYGAGNTPVARGRSRYSAEGSITLYRSEIAALIRAAKLDGDSYGSIMSIPEFDIVVSYIPDNNNGIPVVDTLKNCRFLNNGVDSNEGDSAIQTEIELIISHIKWG